MHRQEATPSKSRLTHKSMLHSYLAEREGFEPSVRFKPHTAFPVLLLQPLGHLSGTPPDEAQRPRRRQSWHHSEATIAVKRRA